MVNIINKTRLKKIKKLNYITLDEARNIIENFPKYLDLEGNSLVFEKFFVPTEDDWSPSYIDMEGGRWVFSTLIKVFHIIELHKNNKCDVYFGILIKGRDDTIIYFKDFSNLEDSMDIYFRLINTDNLSFKRCKEFGLRHF